MGLTRQRRNRLESIRGLNDEIRYSIGTTNIKYQVWDEQVHYDRINKKLDERQKKIDAK